MGFRPQVKKHKMNCATINGISINQESLKAVAAYIAAQNNYAHPSFNFVTNAFITSVVFIFCMHKCGVSCRWHVRL